ncbi:MAG TPA: NAD(P)-binding protein [Steroidobacteraceae bacterium]|nr:NAD(P)-binding protein [Steroidobacteraceae bacterium]
MNNRDRVLGMNRDISRRDFMNGVALVAGSLALPMSALAAEAERAPDSPRNDYPPARMGMRGSHPGSFEVAHAMRQGGAVDTSGARRTGETHDLIIVGGGLSGLAAAHFFLKDVGWQARVLVLDNHDDFGGHAKRNELTYQGKLLAINGGTLEIESPSRYNQWAMQLLRDIGVDLDRYVKANATNERLYASFGLRNAHYFDKETFGVDRLVTAPAVPAGAPPADRFTADHVRDMPISDQAKKDLIRLGDPGQPDYMAGLSFAQKKDRLARISYQDYLLNVAKVDKQAYWFHMAAGRSVFCVGGDALPALFAWQMGEAGFDGLKLDPSPDGLLADLPGGQHGRQKPGNESIHFPDGNATLARLLVRSLIPDALPGNTQEDLGTGRVNYALLDRESNAARIRLNSTVLNVRHDGDAGSAREVIVTYSQDGQLYEIRGRACIMACWNMFIPYLAPELPAAQREALAFNVKGPIVYTNVFLRNWKPFEKLGISSVECPTMYHDSVELAEAADLGSLHHARNPSEPIAVRLTRTPGSPGLPRKQQHRIGREELLATSFETFEYKIRDQLARILSPGGFEPARDIVGIAVNRWPHGYSYTYNSLYDPMEWVFTETASRPCVIARQPYGLISIANADAAASPHTDAAILEAHRAVGEVLERRAFPFVPRDPKSTRT